jgi:hypothetical protein
MAEHVLHKCDKHDCSICNGGLADCTVCGGAEAALPTDCPGERMTGDRMDAVQIGLLDFRGGKWVKLCQACTGSGSQGKRYLGHGDFDEPDCEPCNGTGIADG